MGRVCHARSDRLAVVPVASRATVSILGASGSFYDEVLRELGVRAGRGAVRGQRVGDGGAADLRLAVRSAVTTRPGSPVRVTAGRRMPTAEAPLARTVTYLVIGFVVMIAGLGVLINK